MVDDIAARLPAPFDLEKAQARFPVSYQESMNNVLCQEMLRYNRLTAVIRTSLAGLAKARRCAPGGHMLFAVVFCASLDAARVQVMNTELDEVFQSMSIGTVPALWMGKSFPSLMPLSSYISDLLRRLRMFSDWCALPLYALWGRCCFTRPGRCNAAVLVRCAGLHWHTARTC
jgi:dynein heavy chain, axonemal